MRQAAALIIITFFVSNAGQALTMNQPGIDDQIGNSSLIVHGTVTTISGCVSLDGGDAYSFITLQIQEVLLGTIPGATPGSFFTVRLPVGEYPDGSFRTITDYPQITTGEEVVLFLGYGASGEPTLFPLPHYGLSVLRLIPDASLGGVKRVVNGHGEPYLKAFGRFPPRGDELADARSMYGWDSPIQLAALQSSIHNYASTVAWDGNTTAEGTWSGKLKLSVADPFSAGELKHCVASLSGTLTESSLSATGTCDADVEGTLEVEVSGTPTPSGWEGSIAHNPKGDPGRLRTVSWSSTEVHPDLIVGSSSGNCSDDGSVASWTALFYMTFAGQRPLLSWSEFRSELVTKITSSGSTGGTAQSITMTDATCDASIEITAVGG